MSKKSILIVVAVLMSISFISYAKDKTAPINTTRTVASEEDEIPCDGDSTSQVYQCNWIKIRAAKKRAGFAMANARNAIEKAYDGDPERIAEVIKRMGKSTQAYIRWANEECRFYAADMLGGSYEKVIVSDCLGSKWAERAQQIEDYTKSIMF